VEQNTDCSRRVLFVLDHFYPYVGGGETLFWELSRALVRQGHQVRVVTSRQAGCAQQETIAGIQIHRIRTPRWLGRYLFVLMAFPAALRNAGSADIVHTILYGAAFPAWLAAVLRRKPVVLSVYEVFGSQWHRLHGMSRWKGCLFRVFEWFLLRLPYSRVICISEFTRRRLANLLPRRQARMSVVYPAVDYTFWNPDRHTAIDLTPRLQLPPDAFVYLYFGRPGPSKGVDTLVAAAAKVRRSLPHARLVLLLARDPANGYRKIRQQIGQLQLEDHVVVHDPVPREELPGWLLAADCVVVPSLSEGFGYSAVEAATLGCRVVATSGHAVEEVMKGGPTRFVPQRDPGAIADAIVDIAAAAPAVEPASRQYTLEKHVAGVIAVYEAARVAAPVAGQS
jgi:glycosyltransferase involved in cell wall biosynthesis